MKKFLIFAALLTPLFCGQAMAQTAQQGKMTSCNKEATGKTGADRKAFMKDCLSAKSATPAKKAPSAAQQAQRDKMSTCNADAKTMKGDERKKFMKTCLAKK